MVEEGKKFLRWNKKGEGNAVILGKEQQVWLQIYQPGGYFTLNSDPEIDHVLTAVSDSLQIIGTIYRFSSSIFYVKNHLFCPDFLKSTQYKKLTQNALQFIC